MNGTHGVVLETESQLKIKNGNDQAKIYTKQNTQHCKHYPSPTRHKDVVAYSFNLLAVTLKSVRRIRCSGR